jgi:hypothetical protein
MNQSREMQRARAATAPPNNALHADGARGLAPLGAAPRG